MGREKSVLYLNLEEYAGFDVLMNRQFDGDISDLMYFSGSGKGNLISKLGGLVQTINNLDYIPPFPRLICGVSSAANGWD